MTTGPKAPYFADVAEGPAGATALWLRAGDGVRLRMGHWPAGRHDAAPEEPAGPAEEARARGTILMFPGRTEYLEKYGPTAAEFTRRGYAFAAIDWRGQGLSDRLHADRRLGHVGRFTDYQLDCAAFLTAVRAAGLPDPWFLLSHSMGGAIGLRALIAGLPVRAAVFSAPMWGICLPKTILPIATSATGAARLLGIAGRYAPGTGSGIYVMDEPFSNNLLTTDADMFRFMQRQSEAHPDLAIGGPSLHWLDEALRDCRALSRLPSPDLPCLTTLGSLERIVDAGRIRDRMACWPGGTLELYAGAAHEVMMERPALRARFYERATALFGRGTNPPPPTA